MQKVHYHPEQVQDFTPTPMTLSTCMYYTGIDPDTFEKVYVPTSKEKQMQRALLQYRLPKNRELVSKAVLLAGLNKEQVQPKKDENISKKKKIRGQEVFRKSLNGTTLTDTVIEGSLDNIEVTDVKEPVIAFFQLSSRVYHH